MDRFEKLGLVGAMVVMGVVIALLYGWAVTLYSLAIGCINFAPDSNWALLLFRAIGVFVFPIGGLTGLCF